jgi:hypothetical protein
MMKFILITFISCFFSLAKPALAQNTIEDENRMMSRPLIVQNGKLFVIQFAPKAKRFDVLAAGNTVATLDPSQIGIFGRTYPVRGQPRDLRIVWLKGHFEVSDPIPDSQPIEINVRDKTNAQTETFHFKNSKK